MEEKISFGKFIARKRKEKSLTQRELAEQLYVTESAVSKWERGVSYPDITLVAPICQALDITEHELIAGAEDVQQRTADRQAQKYRTLVRAWSWTFYILYAVSLAVCFVVNLAVEHRLSWFFSGFRGRSAGIFTDIAARARAQKQGYVDAGGFLRQPVPAAHHLLHLCRRRLAGRDADSRGLWILRRFCTAGPARAFAARSV